MDTILEMSHIHKTFPGVKALNDVNIRVKRGNIHALVGENGAGKSTLMKILSGLYPYGSYEGDISFDGKIQQFKSISDSEALGIIIIHQELALVSQLSIGENIFMGNEQATAGVLNWQKVYSKSKELLTVVGLDESPNTLITNCGVGKQQLVEIAKALSKKVKLLILDEPTSSLNEKESDDLLNLLLSFKEQGITSILISHKLNEISKVADEITVLRDGGTIEHINCKQEEISENRIIKAMVGREMTDRYPKRNHKIGTLALEVKDWNVYHPIHSERKIIKDVNLSVHRGEVVGIAGLMGAGRTELAMSLFGKSYGRRISGTVCIDGEEADIGTIDKAIRHKIAYVTEDRKEYGLVLAENVKKNISLANLSAIANYGVIDDMKERDIANDLKDKLNIKCSNIAQHTVNLSGGNQQKVVLGKWLFSKPEILILDEPTRGIDVGAKYEIYSMINELASQDKAIIVISSEMPELLGISDRIYVMNEGCIVGNMPTKEASQEKIMHTIMKESR